MSDPLGQVAVVVEECSPAGQIVDVFGAWAAVLSLRIEAAEGGFAVDGEARRQFDRARDFIRQADAELSFGLFVPEHYSFSPVYRLPVVGYYRFMPAHNGDGKGFI